MDYRGMLSRPSGQTRAQRQQRKERKHPMKNYQRGLQWRQQILIYQWGLQRQQTTDPQQESW